MIAEQLNNLFKLAVLKHKNMDLHKVSNSAHDHFVFLVKGMIILAVYDPKIFK